MRRQFSRYPRTTMRTPIPPLAPPIAVLCALALGTALAAQSKNRDEVALEQRWWLSDAERTQLKTQRLPPAPVRHRGRGEDR